MSRERKQDDRRASRAFRPSLDGRLESRMLLSAFIRPRPDNARPAAVQGRTARGGARVRLRDSDGEIFDVTVENAGVVRARPLAGGRVGIIVDGSTVDSNLIIDFHGRQPAANSAHKFAKGQAKQDRLINIGFIEVSSGKLGSILGYRTAKLSGPILVGGTETVNRIALYSLEPGAAIGVGGDLGTLDIFNEANIVGGTGISVGRDLNVINVGTNLTLGGGASLRVGRDLGAFRQAAQGTGPGGQGGTVNGNLALGPGSSITVNRFVFAPIVVRGTVSAASGQITQGAVSTFQS
jgi:hypothetical protein